MNDPPFHWIAREWGTAMGRASWGLVFLVDVRLGVNRITVDLLPDPVGVWMIYTALASLGGRFPDAASARASAGWLSLLSLLTVVKAPIDVPDTAVGLVLGVAGTALGIVLGVLETLVMWRLCGVVSDMAAQFNARELVKRARLLRILFAGYVAGSVAASIGAVIFFRTPVFGLDLEMFLAIFIGWWGLGLTVILMIIHLLRSARDVCLAAAP